MSAELTGLQKTAVLISLLDEDAAAKVLRELSRSEVRRVMEELSNIEMVDAHSYEGVLCEFQQMIMETRGLKPAGSDLARRLLERARPEEAEQLMREILSHEPEPVDEQALLDGTSLLPDALQLATPRKLTSLLVEEPPQTVAMVLALLPTAKSAQVLALIDQEQRIEITRRMAAIKELRPDAIRNVGKTLEKRLEQMADEPLVPLDGVKTAADALGGLGRASGQEIVDALNDSFPELAAQLRDMLFTFDMLRGLTDKDTQTLLRSVERADLALALCGADELIRDIFVRNMSERAGAMLTEEMDLLGSPKVTDIEQAQRKIVEQALKLEGEGSISIEEQSVVTG